MHWTLCFPTNNVYFRLFFLFIIFVVSGHCPNTNNAACKVQLQCVPDSENSLRHRVTTFLLIDSYYPSCASKYYRSTVPAAKNLLASPNQCFQWVSNLLSGKPNWNYRSTFHEVRIFQGAKSIRCLLLYPLPGLWMHHKLQEQVGSEWTCRKWCRNQHMRPNKLEAESKDRISKRSLLPCQSIFSWWYFSEVSFLGLIVIIRSRRRRADADLQ